MTQAAVTPPQERPFVTFDTDPGRYRHWKLSCDGAIATLTMDVDENGGLRPGYKLKLNSYDLGVDIELHDALQRIRFEHPQVRTVVLTSAKDRVFCSGANIFMLGLSSHAWKVNFCKFTNETRNGMEESSRHAGLRFLAACNGTTAGGGYELALACDEVWLIDDRSAAVSLPEIPLLGVLPGTGGLTRLTDKRRVRRDLADQFCTLSEGVRAPRAREWKLIDGLAKPQKFAEVIRERALQLAQTSDRPRAASGVRLTPLRRTVDARGYHYQHVDVELDARARTATITVRAPSEASPADIEDIQALGADWWPLAMARELDDAILLLRTNELEIGTWILKTRGDPAGVLSADAALLAHANHWFVRETLGMLGRTLARLDVSSRTLFALIDSGSCFAGTLFELALAADRSYMLADAELPTPRIVLSGMNLGPYETVARVSRLSARFYGDPEQLERLRARAGDSLDAGAALELGLVTATPDALDWDDELRIALEERTSLSPDALTGMEASLRFGPGETLETRIFGRLSAWQNWIFNRPNAVGEAGALRVFGTGHKARFGWERV
ncbi:MAG TPA: 2,3-epoxybenzoyl-CoA dihydrolase [Steroidobacteraceae bacterium]|nr:2,3-epoxybenzoyl-CoA dihydrolase [Steroidobacteraceae bacterium]